MFAFDVQVDESSRCLAGVGAYGVLTVLVRVAFRSGSARSSPAGSDRCFTTLEVGGSMMEPPGHSLGWLYQHLERDAEVVVRLVHRDEVDPPIGVTSMAGRPAAGGEEPVDEHEEQAPAAAGAGRGGVDVFVNGSKRCRAESHGDRGVLAALMWTCRSPENRADLLARGRSAVGDELCVYVLGDAPDGTLRTWLHEPLVVGDEVRVVLVG
jgi:hypothetical protein